MNRREFNTKLFALSAGAIGLPFPAWPHGIRWSTEPRVDGERLMRQIQQLSAFGANERGGVDRVAFSDADVQGRAFVRSLMEGARLRVDVDSAGNLIGRRTGREPGLPPIALGSHIDSVPDGGNYDGPVGSLAAIEAVRILEEQEIVTRHPLEVFVFSNEEGGKTGSRVLSGEFEARELALNTASGRTIEEGLEFIGGAPDQLARARRTSGSIAAFLELHIEQGAVLETAGTDIGVVQGIVGIKRWEVTVEGFANHAGTTPMDQRRDALLSAARFVQVVRETARSVPGSHVATVGRIRAEPGAPNVIAGRAIASLEIRDLDADMIDRLFEEIRQRSEQVGREDGTEFSFQHTYFSRPALSDPAIQATITEIATRQGLTTRTMPSGAGHDAQSMAQLGPMGMIFIPSVGGISHSPLELTHPADIVNGANVLLGALLELDSRLSR